MPGVLPTLLASHLRFDDGGNSVDMICSGCSGYEVRTVCHANVARADFQSLW